MGPTIHSQGQELGGSWAPHWRSDGADTVQPIVHMCWSVPRRVLTAAHKADVTRNRQCISMRGSYCSSVCVCVRVCVGWVGWRLVGIVTKPNIFAGCTSLSIVEYVIQNQANDYLPSLQALTQFWFMIQMNIDFPGASNPPTHTHPPPYMLPLIPSISPFNKRVNDVCALIFNQLFLSSFYLSLDKFSVAPVEGNASLSRVLCLITNWPSAGKWWGDV